jgi:hypothetical protein
MSDILLPILLVFSALSRSLERSCGKHGGFLQPAAI